MNSPNPYKAPQGQIDTRSSDMPDLIATARFIFTQDHFMETLNRIRSQSRLRRAWLWFRYIPVTFFMLGALMILFAPLVSSPIDRAPSFLMSLSMFAFLLALSVLCYVPHKFDDFLLKRQFKKSPFRDAEYEFTISQEGFAAVSDVDKSVTKWPVFSGVVVFDDGLLLCRVGNAANWLPRDAFEDNNYENAIKILSSRFELQHAT